MAINLKIRLSIFNAKTSLFIFKDLKYNLQTCKKIFKLSVSKLSLISNLRCGETVKKTPRRKPKHQYSPTSKSQLSSDARIIVALIKNQPLTKKEICDQTKISIQTFYRNISILNKKQIIKCVDQKYALRNFEPLETKIESAFSKLMNADGAWYVLSDDLVSELGLPWHKIESLTLKIAKKLGSEMSIENGKYHFLKPGIFKTG